MGTLQGAGAVFSATGWDFKASRFNGALNAQLFDSTGFGDGEWIVEEPVLRQVIGSASGVMNTTVPLPAGAFAANSADALQVAVVLTFATGKTWSFTANIVVSDFGRSESATDSSVVRIDFRSTGAVVQAWA